MAKSKLKLRSEAAANALRASGERRMVGGNIIGGVGIGTVGLNPALGLGAMSMGAVMIEDGRRRVAEARKVAARGAAIDDLVARASGRNTARAAARRASSEMQAAGTMTGGTQRQQAAPAPASDGQTDAYTRIVNGQVVHVSGYATRRR